MTENALGEKYIGFLDLKPGNVIRLKNHTSFHKPPDTLSLGHSFPINTCFTILEASEPYKVHETKERKITVLHDNKIWHKLIRHVTFPHMFEVIL